jgi:hypothetical protein
VYEQVEAPEAPSEPRKNPHLVRLEEAMSVLIPPLQEQLAEVNKAIEDKKHEQEEVAARFLIELGELREARRVVTHTLRSINPDLAPPLIVKKNGKVKAKAAKRDRSQSLSNQAGVGQEKLDRLTRFLQDHREEINANGGMSARTLVAAHPELHGLIGHRSSIAKAMKVLHEQGLLVLDRWIQGRARDDGSHFPGKYYKVA